MNYRDALLTLFGKKRGSTIASAFPTPLRLIDEGLTLLRETKGCSKYTYEKIKAAIYLSTEYDKARTSRDYTKVSCPEDVGTLMIPVLKNKDREEFWAILLNTKNGIISKELVTTGSLNAALVHPREVFKAAVIHSAAGLILVHNHPTGNPEPSREDTDLTVRFAKCGELMGIDLVDHIIIGGDRFISMRERGLVTS